MHENLSRLVLAPTVVSYFPADAPREYLEGVAAFCFPDADSYTVEGAVDTKDDR